MYTLPLFLIFYFIIFQNGSAVTVDITGQSKVVLELNNVPCKIDAETCKTDVDLHLKGEKGNIGQNGVNASQGLKGDPGPKGVKGSTIPGLKGPDGISGQNISEICSSVPDDDDINPQEIVNIEQEWSTLKEKCCSVGSGDKKITGEAGMLYCNPPTKEICVTAETLRDFHRYADEKPFWISKVFDMTTMYRLTAPQIEFLQTMSSSARQTLRYHCKNIAQDSNRDGNKTINLLMWNDVVIDSNNDEHPYYYRIPKATDQCSQLGTGMDAKSSEIILDSTIATRLPIKDMQIKLRSKEEQQFYLENVELCFGCPVEP